MAYLINFGYTQVFEIKKWERKLIKVLTIEVEIKTYFHSYVFEFRKDSYHQNFLFTNI